jgi:predicted Holliday junction resolvase-like endonuclease
MKHPKKQTTQPPIIRPSKPQNGERDLKPYKDLIAELQRDKRFMGTCPVCELSFRLADATLFSDDDKPTEALEAIRHARTRIRERKVALAAQRELMTTRAQNTSTAVNLGKIIEKIVPSFQGFGYTVADCRALFEPLDYIVFSGLAASGRIDALAFLDVKSGKSRLSNTQRDIKAIVESGKVRFELTQRPPKAVTV